MTDQGAHGGDTLNKRRKGRRKDDAFCLEIGVAGRDRRRPQPQTHAAAQSVVMAHLTLQSAPKSEERPIGIAQTAAQGYAAARPRQTAEEKRRAEFMAEAELKHQAAQKAWVFERRRGSKPRSLDVEDAEIL